MTKRASPKPHWRRAHIRQCASGKNVPVRGHRVNGYQRRKT